MAVNYQNLEKTLLDQAVEAVFHETGLKLKPYDGVIAVDGYKNLRFTAEVKRWAQQANLGVLVNQVKQLPMKGMLVADYVNPKMADKLRELEVPFIDAVGNAYINEKPLYIFIKGIKNNPPDEMVHTLHVPQTRGRAFNTAGIKMLYALMQDPDLVNAPYRDIANITGVALGTVGWVINDLKQAGYLVEQDKKHRRLKNKKQLLDKWVDGYLEKLRPKLFLGIFTTENDHWWKDLDENIVKYGASWGGEVAAAKLTGYLKPEKVTVYLPKEGGNELLADNRLRKAPNGNIQVYRAFWDTAKLNLTDTVDPVIVYADLLATGDPRNLETARIIYDKKIAGLVREN